MAVRTTRLQFTADGGQAKAELRELGAVSKKSFQEIKDAAQQTSVGLGTLSEGVRRAKQALSEGGKELTQVAGAVAKLPGLTGLVAGGLTAVGTVALAAAKNAAAAAVELRTAAAATGLHVERYQEYVFWATKSNVATDTLTQALGQFTRGAAQAKNGTGELYERINRLDSGFAQTVQGAGNLDAALQRTIEWIASAGTETERTARATAAFEQEGLKLLPMLQQGTAGFRAAAEQGRALGIVMNEDVVRGAAQAHANLNVLSTFMSGALRGAVTGLVGILDAATGRLFAFAQEAIRVLGLQASARAALATAPQRAVGADVDALDKQIANLRQNLSIAGPAFSRGGAEIELRIKALKQQRRDQLQVLDKLGRPEPDALDYNVPRPSDSQFSAAQRELEGLGRTSGGGGGGRSRGAGGGSNREGREAERAIERAQQKLLDLEREARDATLDGVDLIMAKRDDEYRAWRKLAEEANLSQEQLARGYAAIWKASYEEITDAQKGQADDARKAASKAAEEAAKPFDDLVDGLSRGFSDLWRSFFEDGRNAGEALRSTLLDSAGSLVEDLARVGISQAFSGLIDAVAVPPPVGGAPSAGSSGAATAITALLGPAGGSLGGLSLLSGFTGATGTASLLTLGLGLAQQQRRISPLSGGLLGLSAARTAGGYLANTAIGQGLWQTLGTSSAGEGLLGAFSIVPQYGVTGGSIGPATAQQAASLGSSVSSLVSIVGSLYSLYSSVDGTMQLNRGFRRSVYGDTQSTANFAAGSYVSLAVGAGAGAAVGAAVGSAGGPLGTIAGALGGAAVGAAVSQAISQALAEAIAKGTRSGVTQGLSQRELDRRVYQSLGGNEQNVIEGGGFGRSFNQSLIAFLRLNEMLLSGGVGEKSGLTRALFKSLTPDIEDIFDKGLARRLNPNTGLEFDRTLTVLGQGTTRGQRENVAGELDRIREFSALFNQISGAGSGGGERDRRTAAIIANTIARRADSPEEAARMVDRTIRGFFGNSIDAAVAGTNRQFFNRRTGDFLAGRTRGEYEDQLAKVLDAFQRQLPRGLDATRVALETLERYARATGDRVLRVARNLNAEDAIAGNSDTATFDGFQFDVGGTSPRKRKRGARRGLREAESAVADAVDQMQRAQIAARFGGSADSRLASEQLQAQFDALEGLKPGQFRERLPELVDSIVSATNTWGQSLSGLVDQLRQLDEVSRATRLGLGETIDALLVAGRGGGLNTADRYTAEMGRLYAGLPLAKSGGARVGLLTSLANTEQGRLAALIGDREEEAATRGVRPLAALNAGAQGVITQLGEVGRGPATVRRQRQAALDAALAKFRAADGVDRAQYGQEVLALIPGVLEASGGTRRAASKLQGVAGEVGGVTAAAEREAKALDARIRADQIASAERLKSIAPALDKAYADQAGEIRAGLAKGGFSASDIDAALADPAVQAQLVQRAQLDKLTGLLEAIEDLRDRGFKLRTEGRQGQAVAGNDGQGNTYTDTRLAGAKQKRGAA